MFEFVSVDSGGRTIAADRARIRSQAARGKNKRPDSRRARREARRLDSLRKEAAARAKLPCPPPHDLQLIPFAEDVGNESQELLYKMISSVMSQQAKPPLERCIDFTLWDATHFEWLQCDHVFLQSVLTSAAMVEEANRVPYQANGGSMRHHLHRTITTLNSRLSEKDAHLEDSTLTIVLTLALLACALGDRAAVHTHLSGLYRIVQLRGGVAWLAEHPLLHFRINHVDMTWAMMSGERPFFLPVPKLEKRALRAAGIELPENKKLNASGFTIDKRIIAVFQQVQHAVKELNQARKNGAAHNENALQPILDSVHSRLSCLEGQIDDSFSECLRLAMLLFGRKAVNFPSVQFRAVYLEMRLRKTWTRLGHCDFGALETWTPVVRDLEFWISVVTAGSLDAFRDDALTRQFLTTVQDHMARWRDANPEVLGFIWAEDM